MSAGNAGGVSVPERPELQAIRDARVDNHGQYYDGAFNLYQVRQGRVPGPASTPRRTILDGSIVYRGIVGCLAIWTEAVLDGLSQEFFTVRKQEN